MLMKIEFEATEEVAKILENLIDKDKYINVAVQLLNEAVITERKKAERPFLSVDIDTKVTEMIKGNKVRDAGI